MSNVLSCDKCMYKSSLVENLRNHVKQKHTVIQLPCELCNYVATTPQEYEKHVENKHLDRNSSSNNKKSSKPNNKKEAKDDSRKKRDDNVKIPCDICDFTSASAEDFITHVETKHYQQSSSADQSHYECNRCDYKGSDEAYFKKHLEKAHELNVTGRITHKSKKLCINWNQGHCSYDNECRFEHKEIQACMFKERCSRMDCKFWHESKTGKFPFLDLYHHQLNPNLPPKMAYPRRN